MITREAKNILIGDDDLLFRVRIGDILLDAGHNVAVARDGAEVQNFIKSSADWPDLLCLDLNMPRLDGFAVLKWLSDGGYGGRFPVLIVTGAYAPGAVIERLKDLHASGVLAKSFTPEEMIFRINRMLYPEKGARGTRPRVAVSIPAGFDAGSGALDGRVLNISETGLFLHTDARLAVGSTLRLNFKLPGGGRTIEAAGVVKWGTGDGTSRSPFGGYGVMFTAIYPGDADLLAAFMEKELHRYDSLFALPEAKS